MKQTSSQEKGSMVEMEFKRPVNDSSTAANASKPELLKNSNVVVQAPQKISVEVHSQNSQGDSTNQLVDKSLKSQSIPILRTQSLKRKMNDSLNASMTALKQDKKVNFAFPQGEKGRSENSDVHNIIPIVSETVRDVDMKDAKEGDTNISGYTEVEYPNFASPQFDITFTGNQDADDNLFVSDPDKNQSNFSQILKLVNHLSDSILVELPNQVIMLFGICLDEFWNLLTIKLRIVFFI
ncbi:hypothetical protein HHI36_016164 [Cryptolaemus montrouzieri]|uniref:Uncharacterized protein n=1 Tax=Cryptolaemus montrouzieri TaxID=559131 RepID=A0ABD2NJF0_9CUCU